MKDEMSACRGPLYIYITPIVLWGLVEVYYRWPAYVHFVFLCTRYQVFFFFITAWGWGDPHITTLDDEVYTFNGLGEYTLLQLTPASGNGDFTLQGRTELVVNSTATQFSAFAFGSPSADMVEVSILHTQVHIHILQLLNKHAVIIESHSNKFARTTL